MHRLLALLIALACFGLAQTATADPVFPPGLQAGLEPAGDLKIGKGRPGFEDVDRNVTTAILQFPAAAYEGVQQALFGKDPPGATDVKRESFPFREGIGDLYSARVVENGVATRHWLLLVRPPPTPGYDFVAVVNVNVPDTAAGVYSDAIVRAMLASVSFRQPPIEEQLGLLPFTLGDQAGFRVMQVQMPNSLILTEGPTDDISRQPYMIISIGRAEPTQLEDRPRFSRDLLSSAPLHDLTLQLADEMRIGNRPGFEIRAQAKGLNGEPVKLVQWVRFYPTSFLRVIGAAAPDRWDEMFNRFRAVRDGIDLR